MRVKELYSMPAKAWACRPDCLTAADNSLDLMKFSKLCVQRGRSLSTYSAPTIAKRKDLGLRLMVEKNTQPPGFTIVAHARTMEPGSGTCSSISMHVTTSNSPGCS